MKINSIMLRAGVSRKTLVRLLGTVGPVLAITFPGVAMAQTAVNTARVAAPSGTFETNTANNESIDTDTVLAVMVATNDSATGINGLAGATALGIRSTGPLLRAPTPPSRLLLARACRPA
jgi:hypothetical protein